MNLIEKVLSEFPVMILDGAMSSELEAYGCDLNDPLWSAKVLIDNPELIKKVHTAYFEAGADCAITASYQATIPGFMERGMTEKEAIELIQKSVQIAVDARDVFWEHESNQLNRPKPLIAASVGPYGAYLADGSEYRGDYRLHENELMDFHRTRLGALIEAGADILACETIPCLIEAKAIVKVQKEFSKIPSWITFSAKDGLHISSGERIAECAKWAQEQKEIAAIGINCTAPEFVASLVNEIREQTDKPIIVYPNSGAVYDPVSKVWEQPDNGKKDSFNPEDWYKKGATIIGGCCGVVPADIKKIVESLRG